MSLKQTYPALLFVAFAVTVLSIPAFSKPPLNPLNPVELFNIRDTVPANDTSAAGKIYESVEEEAYFAGGESAWRRYLEQNLNPSVPVDNGAKAGLYTVYIQFVVDIDGKISDIKPLTKHGFGMEAEVMRILRISPSWVPAVQHGRKVRAYRKQPVSFQIVDERKKRRGRG
ncbi:MAG: energy transducer TonB [Chitinophagaceae bacterium]